MSEASPTPDQIGAEQIQRELAELGEASPDPVELALKAVEDEPDVATVARLHELAEPLEFEELSELELHRGWREIERRIDDGSREAANGGPSPAGGAGGGVRRWPYLAAGLAVAAAVAFVVVGPRGELEPTGPSADEVAELGEAARASLRALEDGKTDTQRAASMAAEYELRLQQEQGG